MGTHIITREEGGIVPVSHTTARVQRPAGILLVHHTGDTGWPKPGWSDPQHMRTLQSFSSSVGKTWEYNYVITYPNGDIWEQAGEFQAAHCLNANGFSYGVQINQAANFGPPGKAQVDSFRWLVAELKARGQITPNCTIKPHYYLRNTGCSAPDLSLPPGPRWNSPTGEGSLGDVRPELLVPWTGVPSAPPGGIILTPEDKAYLDGKFNELWQMVANDHRGIMRAPEQAAIIQGDVRAVVTEPATLALIAKAVQAGLDPAKIEQIIKDAIANADFPPAEVDTAAIAKAVVDSIVLVQRQDS